MLLDINEWELQLDASEFKVLNNILEDDTAFRKTIGSFLQRMQIDAGQK